MCKKLRRDHGVTGPRDPQLAAALLTEYKKVCSRIVKKASNVHGICMGDGHMGATLVSLVMEVGSGSATATLHEYASVLHPDVLPYELSFEKPASSELSVNRPTCGVVSGVKYGTLGEFCLLVCRRVGWGWGGGWVGATSTPKHTLLTTCTTPSTKKTHKKREPQRRRRGALARPL